MSGFSTPATPRTPEPNGNPAQKSADAVWSTRKLLQWIEGFLGSKGVNAPRVCAQMLMSHVLQCDRTRLYMEADRPASRSELSTLRALVQRAGKHEPVQYLVGEAWFWSKRFAVGPATLIPRACTEHLVEHAVKGAQQAANARVAAGEQRAVRVLEIGTGTGCISVCVAAALRGQRRGGEAVSAAEAPTTAPAAARTEVHIVATDIVPVALELARANAQAHGVAEHVEFVAGDLYAPLAGRGLEGTIDVLVSNPPYVSDAEWGALAANVREYEPRSALAGGPEGMAVLAPLIAGAHQWLRPDGLLVLEIGHNQHEVARAAACANSNLTQVEVHKDFEDFWRVLTARRK